jgi:hypothetical protein
MAYLNMYQMLPGKHYCNIKSNRLFWMQMKIYIFVTDISDLLPASVPSSAFYGDHQHPLIYFKEAGMKR